VGTQNLSQSQIDAIMWATTDFLLRIIPEEKILQFKQLLEAGDEQELEAFLFSIDQNYKLKLQEYLKQKEFLWQ
jgi:hypothetical protein